MVLSVDTASLPVFRLEAPGRPPSEISPPARSRFKSTVRITVTAKRPPAARDTSTRPGYRWSGQGAAPVAAHMAWPRESAAPCGTNVRTPEAAEAAVSGLETEPDPRASAGRTRFTGLFAATNLKAARLKAATRRSTSASSAANPGRRRPVDLGATAPFVIDVILQPRPLSRRS